MIVSYIVTTIGRPTLQATLDSIEQRPGDEVLIVGTDLRLERFRTRLHYTHLECPRGNDWGHSEKNFAMPRARGQFLTFMDDDDVYFRGARAAMERAAAEHPGIPTIFRMRHSSGIILWRTKEIACGNVGTPMFFVPNMPSKLGTWAPYYGGDCAFMQSCKWDEIAWELDVIADVRH